MPLLLPFAVVVLVVVVAFAVVVLVVVVVVGVVVDVYCQILFNAAKFSPRLLRSNMGPPPPLLSTAENLFSNVRR